MPSNLKNVPHMVDLFSALGYPKGEFLKQHIALDKQISAFFNKYVAGKGVVPPVPYKWISPGEEIATLAAEFLREDGLGERFWPEQKLASESKLQWPRDKKKIKNNLTFIFRRKANTAYIGACQKSGKKIVKAIPRKSSNQKKQKTPTTESDDDSDYQSSLISERTESDDDSDCQPESSRRLPPGTVCLDGDFGIKPHVERPKDCAITACIRYVKRLNPHHDVKPLKAFTKKWLTGDASWPESADLRLQSYMHDKNFYIGHYHLVNIDEDILGILAWGTELANLEDGMLKSEFKERVRERVAHLTERLITKLFLNCELGGTAVQTETFSRVWSSKEVHFRASVDDATFEEHIDVAPSDSDREYMPRKRFQPWKLRANGAGSDANLPAPKRRRRVQKLRAKQPITPEFPNLRPKPASRSSAELATMATTPLGLARLSTDEEVCRDFVVPPADNMNHPQRSRPGSVQRVAPPQLSGMRKASVGESIEVDTRSSFSPTVGDASSKLTTPNRDTKDLDDSIEREGNNNSRTSTPAENGMEVTLGINYSRPVEGNSPTLTIPDVSSGEHGIPSAITEPSAPSTVTPRPRSFYSSIGSQAKYSPYPTSAETSIIRSAAEESTTQILTLQVQRADCDIDLTAPYRWEEVVANSSLDEFFEFFAEISKTELRTMSELTFQLNFGDYLTFTIPRHGGRIVWEKVKNTVAGAFSGWKRKNPRVMESSITVKGDGVFDHGQGELMPCIV